MSTRNTNRLNLILGHLEVEDYETASVLLDTLLVESKKDEDKTIDDYIKEGWVVQRMNDDTGKKEWCLVDHKGKKTKSGEKRNLKWFGTKKPNVKEVKERIAEIKFFKSKK